MTLGKRELALKLPESTFVGEDDEGPWVTITAGPTYDDPYDRNTEGLLFWHGNETGPDVMFGRGLNSAFVRNQGLREIVWRGGVDDVVHASSVCIARDIRGSAFFPFPSMTNDVLDDEHWIYAITVPEAAATYEVQQAVEHYETGSWDWRANARFDYDPTWSDRDNASCVWQFAEYAVHEVPPANIIGAWKCKRRFLVKARDDERVMAGIRFSLVQGRRNGSSPYASKYFGLASKIAGLYAQTYPSQSDHYLSYFGIVRCQGPCLSAQIAQQRAQQIQRVLVAHDGAWSFPDSTKTEFCSFCGHNSSTLVCSGCEEKLKDLRHPMGACRDQARTKFSR